MSWWTPPTPPTRSALSALALSLVACGRPVLPSAGADACAGARAKVAMQRRELGAGRLLHVVAASDVQEARCPAESAALAALALQAAASLGDAEAVARLRGASPAPAPTIELFAPDGPVAGYSSAEKLSAGYGRAVEEYLGKRWVSAGKLGLAVGVSGGPLAVEGFILAARSAEREGDTARAARMWARAYRVGCAKGCVVAPPRDDLFAEVARFGSFMLHPNRLHCWEPAVDAVDIVHGDWYLTPAPGGQNLREIPSRVLLEHIEAPQGSTFVCYSPNGRQRVAVLERFGERFQRFMIFGTMGSAWKGTFEEVTNYLHMDRTTAFMTNDGRLLVADRWGYQSVDPVRKAYGGDNWPKGTQGGLRSPGDGLFVVELHTIEDLNSPTGHVGPFRQEVVRYDLATGASLTLLPGKENVYLAGPVEEGNRVLLAVGGNLVWMNAATGEKLAEVEADMGVLRVGPSSVFDDYHDQTLDLMTRKKEPITFMWYPDSERDQEAHKQTVLELLPGPSRARLIGREGWTTRFVSDKKHEADVHVLWSFLELARPGRETLRVFPTPDAKGAMVVGADGKFEILGRVSAAFVASASCGPRDAKMSPTTEPRTWPLEVCGAALEAPGLTEAWLADLPAAPASPPPVAP